MGGEPVECFRHNFRGVASYGECPYCRKESEDFIKKHPAPVPWEGLKFSRKERRKLEKMLEKIKGSVRRGVGGLIRGLYPNIVRLEYDPESMEIRDTHSKEGWFRAVNSSSQKMPHINVVGYDLVDAYNRKDLQPENLEIKFIPVKPVPLQSNERAEMLEKIRKLETSLEYYQGAFNKRAKDLWDFGDEILKWRKGNSMNLEELYKIVINYLKRYSLK